MFRSAVTILLAIFMSANFVFTVQLQVIEADTANLEKESLAVALKSNQTKESPVKTQKELEFGRDVAKKNSTLEKDQEAPLKGEGTNSTVTSITRNETTPSSSGENVSQNSTRQIEETTTPSSKDSVSQKKPGNFTGEQANLNEGCVTPHEDEEEAKVEKDVTTIEVKEENVTTSTSVVGTLEGGIASPIVDTLKTNSTEVPPTTTILDNIDPPRVFPVSKDVKSIENADSDIIAKLNATMYETVPPEPVEVTEASVSKTSNASNAVATNVTTPVSTPIIDTTITVNKSENNQRKIGNKSEMLEGLEGIQQAELTEKGKESIDKGNNGSMPSGIIALVTAITFAIAIVTGYISMVVWKQYLEHRYGRRELLVNELEFDTNDLRHFEL